MSKDKPTPNLTQFDFEVAAQYLAHGGFEEIADLLLVLGNAFKDSPASASPQIGALVTELPAMFFLIGGTLGQFHPQGLRINIDRFPTNRRRLSLEGIVLQEWRYKVGGFQLP